MGHFSQTISTDRGETRAGPTEPKVINQERRYFSGRGSAIWTKSLPGAVPGKPAPEAADEDGPSVRQARPAQQ